MGSFGGAASTCADGVCVVLLGVVVDSACAATCAVGVGAAGMETRR